MMFMSVVSVAVDDVPFLGRRTVNIISVNILMLFKFVGFDIKRSSRVDIGPESSDGMVLEALVGHQHVLVDDQVFVKAFEENTLWVDT